MAEILRRQGKETVVVNGDPVPDSLAFLPGSGSIRLAAEVSKPVEVDLLLVLDSAGVDRVGEGAWAAFRGHECVVNIDHHVSNSLFGDLNYVDPKSPATGQIVFQLARAFGWDVTPAARDNLFAAISTDTGSFRYPNTTAETYRIAAELLEMGADVGSLSQALYESYPMRRIELLRELMKEMESRFDGRVMLLKLRKQVIDQLGVGPGDTEGLIDLIRSVHSVIVALFFEDLPNGKIRVSARSKKPAMDVGEICGAFGGGGHQLAAGARMVGPLDEAIERYLEKVKEKLDGLG
jgi:phosphoesterase RecJ-like protein